VVDGAAGAEKSGPTVQPDDAAASKAASAGAPSLSRTAGRERFGCSGFVPAIGKIRPDAAEQRAQQARLGCGNPEL